MYVHCQFFETLKSLRMKLYILFFTLISFSVLSVTAQNSGILVTKSKNQKTKFIKEDSRIRIKSGGKTIKGRFSALSDSTILVQSDTLLLKQISELQVKTFPIQLGGAALLLVGTYSTAFGIVGVVAAATSEFATLGLVFGIILLSPFYVGGVLIATTGILLIIHGRKYTFPKWKYKIVRPIPVADSN
jgi:hypothetical protein